MLYCLKMVLKTYKNYISVLVLLTCSKQGLHWNTTSLHSATPPAEVNRSGCKRSLNCEQSILNGDLNWFKGFADLELGSTYSKRNEWMNEWMNRNSRTTYIRKCCHHLVATFPFGWPETTGSFNFAFFFVFLESTNIFQRYITVYTTLHTMTPLAF